MLLVHVLLEANAHVQLDELFVFVAGSPTDHDQSADDAVRNRVNDCLRNEPDLENLRKSITENETRDKKATSRKKGAKKPYLPLTDLMQLPVYKGVNLVRMGNYGSSALLLAAAYALGIDLLVLTKCAAVERDGAKVHDLYRPDEKRGQETKLTEREALEHLRSRPRTTRPLVVIVHNGKEGTAGHYAGVVLEDGSAQAAPPRWLQLKMKTLGKR